MPFLMLILRPKSALAISSTFCAATAAVFLELSMVTPWAPMPSIFSTRTPFSVVRRTSIKSAGSFSAIPNTSKPGPRFAMVAGDLTTTLLSDI